MTDALSPMHPPLPRPSDHQQARPACPRFGQVRPDGRGFDASITVEKDGMTVGGTSIMGLMMLAASPGCTIRVTASGPRPRRRSMRWPAGAEQVRRRDADRGAAMGSIRHKHIKISLYPIVAFAESASQAGIRALTRRDFRRRRFRSARSSRRIQHRRSHEHCSKDYVVADIGLAGWGRKEIDDRRNRNAGPDGLPRGIRHEEAAQGRAHHRLAAHDHPDGRADRDAEGTRRRHPLGLLQHLLDPGPRRRGDRRLRHSGLRRQGRVARGVLGLHRQDLPVGRWRPLQHDPR
jgi:phosphotransferase system HPr (HPr) family protein